MTLQRSVAMSAGSVLCAMVLSSCAVGRGEGQVESDALVVEGCIDGPYTMDPNFFGAENGSDQQLLRIQRGNNHVDNADNVIIVVRGLEEFAEEFLGEPQPVYLSPELVPEGVPVTPAGRGPQVSLSFHLGETCEREVVALQAHAGTITFDSIYSGQSGTGNKDERLTEGRFDVLVSDPRQLVADAQAPEGYGSPEGGRLTGSFRFIYRRGQAAQTFP